MIKVEMDGKASIFISRDGRKKWEELFHSIKNIGSKIWKGKKPASSNAKIRVRSV